MKRIGFAGLVLLFFGLALPISAQTNALNYCEGQLSYDLPEGWVAGEISRSATAVGISIATSKATLTKLPLEYTAEDALLSLGILRRSFLLRQLAPDTDEDIEALLHGITTLGEGAGVTFGEITALSIDGRAAARVEGHDFAGDQYILLFDFDSDTIGSVLLWSSPDHNDPWKAVALEVAESLALDAPPFPGADPNLPLTQSFSPPDCSFAFVYPDGWTVGSDSPDDLYHLEISSLPNNIPAGEIPPLPVLGDIWWNQTVGDVCMRLDNCPSVTAATPDMLFEALESVLATAPDTWLERLTLGDRDTLLIHSVEDSVSAKSAYVIQTGETFVVLTFSTPQLNFTPTDQAIFSAMASSLYFGDQ
jgi:hypothetical protein